MILRILCRLWISLHCTIFDANLIYIYPGKKLSRGGNTDKPWNTLKILETWSRTLKINFKHWKWFFSLKKRFKVLKKNSLTWKIYPYTRTDLATKIKRFDPLLLIISINTCTYTSTIDTSLTLLNCLYHCILATNTYIHCLVYVPPNLLFILFAFA